MVDKSPFEVPHAMRELAERNLDQARKAYDQFMDAAKQAQSMVSASSDAVSDGTKEIQSKTFEFAENNMNAAMSFASDLAKASDIAEAIEMQQRFAREQMEAFASQAQRLSTLMAETAQNAQKKR